MKKVPSLTPEQAAKFPQYVKEWTDIGLSTKPADRPRAEAAIAKVYQIAGLAKPKIVWCGSPLSQGLTRHLTEKLVSSLGECVEDSVGASVRASVGDGVWVSVRASVRASVSDSVWASVRASVSDSVWASVRASVRASVWASVGASVRASVGHGVWAGVWASVRASVRASVSDSVWASVGASVRASVGDGVWASVGDGVWASVGDSLYGAHEADWLAFYKFFATECGLSAETEKLAGLWELAQSAGWALPHENICWVSERHNVLHQEKMSGGRYRLHCDTGPAVAYPDGWKIYYIHGIQVSEQIVMRPESVNIDQINAEENAEVRRIMVERYGHEKYLRNSKAKLIDSRPANDPVKGLQGAKLWNANGITLLDVLNSTPEPDGTTKRYVIPVDASLYQGRAGRDCLAAMASTWRKRSDNTQLVFERPEDYAPVFES